MRSATKSEGRYLGATRVRRLQTAPKHTSSNTKLAEKVAPTMLKHFLQTLRRKKIGLVMGVFDFAHEGHRKLLARAAQECDELIVAVHTDAWCRSYKTVMPANSELERLHAVQTLGIADRVVLLSDRNELCRRFAITHVLHGDDWSLDELREHWGRLLDRYRLQTDLLPYTDGVSSTTLREHLPRIGWWLHPIPVQAKKKFGYRDDRKIRIHFLEHLRSLYQELGGSWIAFEHDRESIRSAFPDAPLVIMPSDDLATVAKQIASFDYELLINTQINPKPIVQELAKHGSKTQVIVLPHGRSGKKNTHLGVGKQPFPRYTQRHKPLLEQRFEIRTDTGPVPIFDWRFALESYTHLDPFLARGGQFKNPLPATPRPRILLLPTWGGEVKKEGTLLAPCWRKAVAELTQNCDIWLSPHPLCKPKILEYFVKQTGVTLLEPSGNSFALVPDVHCVISDLSGSFFEALLFDTPVILAQSDPPQTWPDDYPPARCDLESAIPFATPETLVTLVRQQIGKRNPQQRALAEQRLGVVDGRATQRVAAAIRELLARAKQERSNAALHHEATPPSDNTEM